LSIPSRAIPGLARSAHMAGVEILGLHIGLGRPRPLRPICRPLAAAWFAGRAKTRSIDRGRAKTPGSCFWVARHPAVVVENLRPTRRSALLNRKRSTLSLQRKTPSPSGFQAHLAIAASAWVMGRARAHRLGMPHCRGSFEWLTPAAKGCRVFRSGSSLKRRKCALWHSCLSLTRIVHES